EIELFAESDEAIDEHFGSLEVDVVVAGAVHDEQMSGETLSEVDGRPIEVAIGRRQAHVAFLIDGVVEGLIGDRGGSDSGLDLAWVAEHFVESGRAAAAVSPHADAGGIDPGMALFEGSDGLRLLLRIEQANPAVDRLTPGATAGSGGSFIIEA